MSAKPMVSESDRWETAFFSRFIYVHLFASIMRESFLTAEARMFASQFHKIKS